MESIKSEIKSLDLEFSPDLKKSENSFADIPRPSIDDIEKLLSESSPEKKKRGRKSNEEKAKLEAENKTQSQQDFEQEIETLKIVVQQGLEFACKRMPNPIPLSNIELQSFTQSFEAVTKKHFSTLVKYSAEGALALSTLFIFAPRLLKQQKISPEKENHSPIALDAN